MCLAAFALIIFCLLQFVVFPMAENRKRLRRSILAKETGLKEMVRLSGEYAALGRQSQTVESVIKGRTPGFTLFSFLEKAAERPVLSAILNI